MKKKKVLVFTALTVAANGGSMFQPIETQTPSLNVLDEQEAALVVRAPQIDVCGGEGLIFVYNLETSASTVAAGVILSGQRFG